MRQLQKICVGIIALTAIPLWAQVENMAPSNSAAQDSSTVTSFDHPEDRMLTPPPVSGLSFPTVITSEDRANYLRYGAVFTAAHTDNALGGTSSTPISDMSYSVAPTIALDESTTRMHWTLAYAPGFTFYQKISSRNEADENASLSFTYRLSPHVTLSAQDGFQKSSNVFNQPDFAAGTVSGQTQVANFSIIAPTANRLSNVGSIGLAYQFGLNDMIGASGAFTNLHYPNPTEVPGLFDSSSQAGSAFYSHRIGQANYIGTSYQYQRLVAYPTVGNDETQTEAALFFYTYSPSTRFSMSFYGGPQYADTVVPPISSSQTQSQGLRKWQPAAGASLNWQRKVTALAVTYAHTVAGGSGLTGAVEMDGGSASIRQMISKTLSGAVSGGYSQNDLLSSALLAQNGHSISGTASLQQLIGQHVSVQLGYTRLHQSYENVTVISTAPNTNREFVSISYQFSRPLGR
jgi:hypothetical protein